MAEILSPALSTGTIMSQVTRISNLVHASSNSLENKTREMEITDASTYTPLADIRTAITKIAVNSESNRNINAGVAVTVPQGYHKTGYTITAIGLGPQTSATAVASDIRSGKTAWVNGTQITGTAPEYSGQTVIPSNTDIKLTLNGKINTGDVVVKAVNYYYVGTSKPSDSTYNDGDIFLVTD